jgi:hypothetical protein
MRFLDIIIENSTVKEAKLYSPAQKASEKPDSGVTIQNPAAYHVIQDCAVIATKYLPIYIFGLYANPFEDLKSKFNFQDIKEFVSAAYSDMTLNQLLTLILEKIKKLPYTPISSSNDPYGDYEAYEGVKEKDVTTLICKAFNVPTLK